MTPRKLRAIQAVASLVRHEAELRFDCRMLYGKCHIVSHVSKRCSYCGYVLNTLPLDKRHWRCPDCHTQHHRDVNAARNILAAGLAELSTVGMHGN